MGVRFLSDEWLARADALIAAWPADGPELVVEQNVRLPDGALCTYHLRVGGGGAGIKAGPAESPDLVLRQEYATAAALNRSELRPADAFAQGLVKVRGNLRVLTERRELLANVGDVLAPLREETDY